jgi:hypothetical protein
MSPEVAGELGAARHTRHRPVEAAPAGRAELHDVAGPSRPQRASGRLAAATGRGRLRPAFAAVVSACWKSLDPNLTRDS